MSASQFLRQHATYNQWINERIYTAARRLSPEELALDQGAYFGSIIETLNHIVAGDSIWLRRLSQSTSEASRRLTAADDWLPTPWALDSIIEPELAKLHALRARLDELILHWTSELSDSDLAIPLSYTNAGGRPFRRDFGLLILHFFNHQTHHRGQVSTLLFQNGIDIGVTDMLETIPELGQ